MPNTDLKALREHWITITPITFDLTDHKEKERLGSIAFDF
jgi:broad specificity polyphosphatase/5'/3'-nucleotidase SurE